ncbi:hypothetical protein [Pajaroellobacter abortibovis]|uniref:hypothetical protein n=1 Tax=Pajaroellobacter abortibovis TaxID=1882918 RepID=UPI0012EB4DD7|nr:hypothetical protein [Pajaroellobacter abortibovis]
MTPRSGVSKLKEGGRPPFAVKTQIHWLWLQAGLPTIKWGVGFSPGPDLDPPRTRLICVSPSNLKVGEQISE